MQIWLFALAGAVAPAPAQVLASSQSPNPSIETATVTADTPAVEATSATASAPKKPVILDPHAKGVAFTAPKEPVIFSPPAERVAPKKPVIFSPPREATGWKAAQAAVEAAKAPVALQSTENSTVVAEAPVVPESTENSASAEEAPVVLKSTENSTGVALAVDGPTDHGIHDQIAAAHKAMCEDGRMDSPHCEKFRNALDEMQDQIKDIHDEHHAQLADVEAAAEESGGAATAAEPDSAVEYTTEVESVKEHEPVIKKHEYPYKTGPCASGTAAVALLFSGLLFA